jgi:hypothetical protein
MSLITLALCLFSVRLTAMEAESLSLGVGNLTRHIGKIQTTAAGEKNSFFEFNPYVNMELKFKFTESWITFSEFALFFPKTGTDEKVSRLAYFLNLGGAYRLSNFHFRASLGLFWERISTEDGSQNLNNGTGFTEFPMPSESSTTQNIISNWGIEYYFDPAYSFRAEASIFNLTNSLNRTFSYALIGVMHFDVPEFF